MTAPRVPKTIEQPAPTAWPMVLAFGLTLIFAGLVTHVMVSAVGAILAATASVGWWRQVFPEPQLEHVPVPEEGVTFPAARSTIGRPAPGEEGHRVRIPVAVEPISAGI